MIIYSHRGNLNGPISTRENDPDYIQEALVAGLHVEIDLRCVGDRFFLGHDFPTYEVSTEWISKRKSKLLVHVKDFESLKLINWNWGWHYFCHVNDPYTVTSEGMLWLHDLSLRPDERSIVPLISAVLVSSYTFKDMHGICSDFPLSCQQMFK